MNGYKELETCGVMLMGLTSSRMVFNHSKFGKKSRKKETNVMVSNMHVTHVSLLLFGFVFWLSCLWFQTSRKKNAFLSLHVLSTFCGREEVLSLGNLRMVSLHEKLNPNKQIDLHVGLENYFFNFQILVVTIEELWHRPTSIYIPFTNHLHVRVHLADIP